MSYTLSQTRSITNEGDSVTIFLDTVGIPDGTQISYSISGTNITTSDFVGIPLTGYFTINANRGSLTIPINADLTTEGSETFRLDLTDPGRTEFITVGINDVSQNVPPIEFSITSPQSIVNEGTVVIFTITANNLGAGNVVPYQAFGITADDLVVDNLIGNVTLQALPGSNTRSFANVSFSIIEDFTSDGIETLFLQVTPSYPFTVQVSSTVVIIDSSISTSPNYSLSVDKVRLIEGDSITLSLSSVNTSVGDIVQWRILPLANSSISVDDFVGLSNLTGNFPPLDSNLRANITFTTRDDFIFEPTEYFYFEIPNNPLAVTQTIELIDSGNTLIVSSNTFTGNITVTFLDKATLVPNIAGLNFGTSGWLDSSGKLSESMVLQGRTYYAPEDSVAFYQPFSYVIRSKRSIEEWREGIKQLLHPAGMALFSEINNETQITDVKNVGVKIALADVSLEDTSVNEIQAFLSLTADSTKPAFRVSNVRYIDSKLNTNITADRAFYIFTTYV